MSDRQDKPKGPPRGRHAPKPLTAWTTGPIVPPQALRRWPVRFCLRCGYLPDSPTVEGCFCCSVASGKFIRLATLAEAEAHLAWLQRHDDALQAMHLSAFIAAARKRFPDGERT